MKPFQTGRNARPDVRPTSNPSTPAPETGATTAHAGGPARAAQPARVSHALAAGLLALAPLSVAAQESTAALQGQVEELAAKVRALEALLAREAQTTTDAAPAASPVVNQELEQKVRVIERKLELAAEDEAKRKKESPAAKLDEKALSFTTSDGQFSFRARGYMQVDDRSFFGDDTAAGVNNIVLRRIRPVFDGVLFKDFEYRIMPDFAGSSFSLFDGYVNFKRYPHAQLLAGKLKGPFGIDRLQSATALWFPERSISNNLAPNRDIGVQLHGTVLGKTTSYALGVFDGVPDLGSTTSDASDDKDFYLRVFSLPLRNLDYGIFQGLGIGVAASWGQEDGTASAPQLPAYVSQGQSTMFRYRSSPATAVVGGTTVTVPASLATTAIADGDRYRFSPQGYWYWGRYGLLGDYIESTQEVRLGANRQRVTNRAWSIAGGVVVTGEDAGYEGVKPASPFDPAEGAWGALELVARYGELYIDEDAFIGSTAAGAGTALADSTASVSEARSWGLGANWYLNNALKVQFAYEQTAFDGGGGGTNRLAPRDRQDEKVTFLRLQAVY